MITVAGDIAYKEKKLEAKIKSLEEKLLQVESEKELELKQEKLETARKFKKQGVSADIISAATGIDLEVIETL